MPGGAQRAAVITEQVAAVKFAVVHFNDSAPGRTAVLGGWKEEI